MIPRAILLKSGTKSLTTARPNKIVSPKKNVSSAKPKIPYNNEAQNKHLKRPFSRKQLDLIKNGYLRSQLLSQQLIVLGKCKLLRVIWEML